MSLLRYVMLTFACLLLHSSSDLKHVNLEGKKQGKHHDSYVLKSDAKVANQIWLAKLRVSGFWLQSDLTLFSSSW